MTVNLIVINKPECQVQVGHAIHRSAYIPLHVVSYKSKYVPRPTYVPQISYCSLGN